MRKLLLFCSILIFLSCSNNSTKIGIQPYGKVNQKILDSVSSILKRTYNAEIIIFKNKKIPKYAYVNIKTPRYRADTLLIDLLKNRPGSIDYILGITSKDISTTKRDSNGNIKTPRSKYIDWGIFGLGYKPGKSCIISTHRLRTANTNLYISRIQKISVHEIGHNMALNHCEVDKCVMNDAVETIKTVDSESYELCEKCLKRI